MNTEKSKIHVLESVRESDPTPAEETARTSTSRDMSKVAMIVSLLSVVLLVIFFFGLNRNLAGVTEEVQTLRGLRQDVQTLGEKVGRLENVPEHIQYGMVTEMEMQSVLLARLTEDPTQMERLQNIRALLVEFKEALIKE